MSAALIHVQIVTFNTLFIAIKSVVDCCVKFTAAMNRSGEGRLCVCTDSMTNVNSLFIARIFR